MRKKSKERKRDADAALQRETGVKCVGNVSDRKDNGQWRDDGTTGGQWKGR